MWDEEESEILDDMDRTFHSLVDESFSGLQNSLFDLRSRTLRPLYRIETTDNEIIVTFDLPCVEKKDISLTATDSVLSIEAKMRNPLSLRVGSYLQKYVEFESYTRHVRLSKKVEPDKAWASFRNGLLTVRFPLSRKGNRVRIQ